MNLQVDLFWSFRSPYSYLLMPRIMRLVSDFDVTVNARPVYPLVVRDPALIKSMHPQFLNYFLLDTARLADSLKMPFVQPDPDPVDFAAALRGDSQQPLIIRLMHLAAAAAIAGRGLYFINELSQMLFGGVQGWETDANMHAAIIRAGLEPAQLEAAVAANPAELDAWIEANQAAHAAAGHWGVPTMVFEGEPFFGQDRFDLLVWRLRQRGLSKRE